MDLTWHGHSCFSLKNKRFNIVMDPYQEQIGIKLPSLSANVVSVSHDHPHHNNTKAIFGEPKILDWPGEYEINDVMIEAIPTLHPTGEGKKKGETLIFTFSVDDINICHLGDLGEDLTNEQLERIGDVDILLIPVGGNFTIDAKKAHELIEEIEPKIVIPMHYHFGDLKVDIAPLKNFLKIWGESNPQELEKLSLEKKDLSKEKTELIILKPVLT